MRRAVALTVCDWTGVPDHPACVERGEGWARAARGPLLRVPSAIVPEEENVLMSPRHPEARRVVVRSVRPFRFDLRHIR